MRDTQPARDVVVELARRLHDPETLAAALQSYENKSRFAATVRWTPAGWGFGGAGLAAVAVEANRVGGGDGWAHSAHHYLRLGAGSFVAEPRLGLFDGQAGFGYVTATLALEGSYPKLAAQVAQRLVPAIVASAASCTGSDTETFDILSGVAGKGIYLLSLAGDSYGEARSAVRDACDRLLRISENTGAPSVAVPVSAEAGFPPQVARSVSCGMAHGVAGLVAVRARLAMADNETGSTLGALRMATSWLMAQRTDDVLLWPRAVLFDHGHRRCGHAPASSAGWWCTGSAGIARALWLSGTATGSAEPRALAMDVIAGLATDQASWPTTAGLCHGVAGLLVIAQEFARDTERPEAIELTRALTDVLVARFDEASLLGFQNVESSGQAVDDPGVLFGSAGIALGLAAAISPGRSNHVQAMGI